MNLFEHPVLKHKVSEIYEAFSCIQGPSITFEEIQAMEQIEPNSFRLLRDCDWFILTFSSFGQIEFFKSCT